MMTSNFEKWKSYPLEFQNWVNQSSGYLFSQRQLIYLDKLPWEMLFGVFVRFFDHCEMQIYVTPLPNMKWSIYIDYFGHHIMTDYVLCKTREEAERKAVEIAFELWQKQITKKEDSGSDSEHGAGRITSMITALHKAWLGLWRKNT